MLNFLKPKPTKLRQQKLFVISGDKGSGKTKLLIEYFINNVYNKDLTRRIVVFNPQVEQDWTDNGFKFISDSDNLQQDFGKVRRVQVVPQYRILGVNKRTKQPEFETKAERANRIIYQCSQIKRCLIIFDDATTMFDSHTDFNRLAAQRQSNNDLLFVFHNPEFIPPDLVRLNPDGIYLFEGGQGSGLLRIPEIIKANQEIVNAFTTDKVKGLFMYLNKRGGRALCRLNLGTGNIDTFDLADAEKKLTEYKKGKRKTK